MGLRTELIDVQERLDAVLDAGGAAGRVALDESLSAWQDGTLDSQLTEATNGAVLTGEAAGLRLGAFFFCGVDMPDAGHGGTPPQDRRYGQADVLKVYRDLEAYATAAAELGYESFWLAEHHFQYEGYEVVPNAILMAAFLAERTHRIKFGAMFNVLPQWHPLRFAEDYAVADVMTGGRMLCGLGRGTVPREA